MINTYNNGSVDFPYWTVPGLQTISTTEETEHYNEGSEALNPGLETLNPAFSVNNIESKKQSQSPVKQHFVEIPIRIKITIQIEQ